MNLTLEVISPGGNPGNPARKVFGEQGGTIGRANTSTWVLLRAEVSGKHALISFRSGIFYIQDTSRNGVWLNSLSNKLVPQRPYPLKSGDRLIIEPFEIAVTVDEGLGHAEWPQADRFAQDDPFAPAPLAPQAGGDAGFPIAFDEGEVDPLKFFQPAGGRPPARPYEPPPPRPPVDQMLDVHFEPPAPMPLAPEPPASQEPSSIPMGYDPLADDAFVVPPPAPPRSEPPPAPRPVAPAPQPAAVTPVVPASAPASPRPAPAGRRPVSSRKPGAVPISSEADRVASPPAPPVAPPPRAVELSELPASAAPPMSSAIDAFARVLEGAGLKDAPVSPELQQDFGRILRVVVSGVMDVLHARRGIKDEFSMRQTMFRPADNNPLKFSANVDDALHNLLVKRNPAYLGAVDAFADAFDDLRDHQIAMLEGMRVAFEHLLAEFDPDRLQQEFDASAAKGLIPAKLRYWDLFVEKRRQMARNPETAFADLFGREFARAYEEQFRELKARRRQSADAARHSSSTGE
ncbi:MAG: type VI secretion system-associated FHA domain protein TagH [Vicinamibacterales bacterium]